MPLKRIECCGPPLSLDKCLEKHLDRNNHCQYTYEVLKAMLDSQQDRGDRISATAVLNQCSRQEVLKRKVNYTVEADDLWAAFKGTLTHAVLEKNIAPGDWGEVRVWAPVPGYGSFISCRPDLVSPKQGILWDYKTAKDVPSFGHIWPDQEAQLQVNRWIIDHAVWVGDESPPNLDATVRFPEKPSEWTSLRIVYITDSKMDVHEVTKSVEVPNKTNEGTHRRRVPDVWSDEKVLDYMLPRYEELLYGLDSHPEYIPAVPKNIDWMGRKFPCGWCPVRAECKRLVLEEKR